MCTIRSTINIHEWQFSVQRICATSLPIYLSISLSLLLTLTSVSIFDHFIIHMLFDAFYKILSQNDIQICLFTVLFAFINKI